jgi:hypothetical protein
MRGVLSLSQNGPQNRGKSIAIELSRLSSFSDLASTLCARDAEQIFVRFATARNLGGRAPDNKVGCQMAVITIGKGQMYSCPYYAAPHVQAGDTVEIFPGTYGGAWFWSPDITIVGMGPGVIITGAPTQGKGLLVLSGKNVTVQNITFMNAEDGNGNGAGIWFGGTNLTVLNDTFINNQDGILTTPNKASTITVKNCTFDGNGSTAGGSKGAAHAIYAGSAALLDVEDSTFTNTKEGHDIKSRANNTIIKNNSITDGPTGTSSYLIDIPNGGAATITGNTLEKGPLSSNYSYAITVGEEGATNPAGAVLIADNTFVNDDSTKTVFAHNQSGNPDFTVANNTISGLKTTILTGQGTVIDPTAAPAQPSAAVVHRPGARDFDGDGKDDLLVMSTVGSNVQIALLNGTAKQSSVTLTGPAATGWTALLTGDFNGDGKTDILWQNNATQVVQIYTMSGTTKTAATNTTVAPGTGWKVVGSGDFDGDQKSDLVLQNGSQVEIWLMDGRTVAGSSVLSTAAPNGFKVISTSDFNGDGKADILWQNSTTGQMQVWMMNGTSLASTATIANNPGANWRAIDTGDFDGDGQTDILLRNASNGQCAVWLMNGTTQVGGGNLASNLGTGWNAVSVSDYNGDGKSDILFRNPSNGAFTEWMMSGATIQSSGTVGFNPGTTFYAVAG